MTDILQPGELTRGATTRPAPRSDARSLDRNREDRADADAALARYDRDIAKLIAERDELVRRSRELIVEADDLARAAAGK